MRDALRCGIAAAMMVEAERVRRDFDRHMSEVERVTSTRVTARDWAPLTEVPYVERGQSGDRPSPFVLGA